MKLKKGKYYIGDPCYLFEDEDWGKVLDETDFFNNSLERNGLTGVAFGTQSGDGVYPDKEGNSYPVDAGLIGAIPEKMVTREGELFGVRLVNFKNDFECSTNGHTLTFGNVVIETGDVPDEDDCNS